MDSAGIVRLRFCIFVMGQFKKRGEIYAKQSLVCRYHCACVCVPIAFDEAFARRECCKTGGTCRTGKISRK